MEKKWIRQTENAIRFLEEMNPAQLPVDRTLAGIFRNNRQFGSRDRQFYHTAVFAYYRYAGWLRFLPEDWKLRLAAALGTELPNPMPPAGQYLLEQMFPDISSDQLLNLTKPERFRLLTGKNVSESDLIPDWAGQALAGDVSRCLLTSRSPLWVRVADGMEQRAETQWRNAGLNFSVHPRIPNAYRFPNDRIRFDSFPVWKDGLMEMQDFSSQCIGLAAGAEPGEHWLDPCAGGGGKTMQLAAMMQGRGTVTVHDIRSFKIDTLLKRAERSPFRNMIRRSNTFSPAGKLFDGVLLDAPCSSSGRWRRDPDARWTKTANDLEEIAELQYELLVRASESVRPGGKLIYGTCSMFHKENSLVAERFLEEFGNKFEPCLFASPHTGEMVWQLQTFPADADCDGSFVAAFRRK